jgi:hypothetical protein
VRYKEKAEHHYKRSGWGHYQLLFHKPGLLIIASFSWKSLVLCFLCLLLLTNVSSFPRILLSVTGLLKFAIWPDIAEYYVCKPNHCLRGLLCYFRNSLRSSSNFVGFFPPASISYIFISVIKILIHPSFLLEYRDVIKVSQRWKISVLFLKDNFCKTLLSCIGESWGIDTDSFNAA